MENTPILFKNQKASERPQRLVPVHINTCRCDDYFWKWSPEHQDWVRDRPISDGLKRSYRQPFTGSVYQKSKG